MMEARRGGVIPFASQFATYSNSASLGICKLVLILLLLLAGDVCSAQDSGMKEGATSSQEPSAENTSEPVANKQHASDHDGSEKDGSEQDANKQNTSEHDTSEHETSEHETNKQDEGVTPPQDGSLAATEEQQKTVSTDDVSTRTMEPHASRVRAVRAIRFSVVVVSVLLSMLTTVVLMQVNRWSHGRYAGRIWWLAVLLVPAWLLVGIVWAWNNAMWNALLDGTLLPF